MKETRLVEITWVDAEIHTPYWDDIEKVVKAYENYGQEPMVTVGYLVAQTKNLMCVAQTLSPNHQGKVSRGGGYLIIPKGWIKQIRHLKANGSPN